jgi:hypothetical protein
MFNSICYELLVELADAVPDAAGDIRRRLFLPPLLLERREPRTVEHVITTDPKQASVSPRGRKSGANRVRIRRKSGVNQVRIRYESGIGGRVSPRTGGL